MFFWWRLSEPGNLRGDLFAFGTTRAGKVHCLFARPTNAGGTTWSGIRYNSRMKFIFFKLSALATVASIALIVLSITGQAVAQEVATEPASPPAVAANVQPAAAKFLITNDAVVFGILMGILGFVFWSSNSSIPAFRAFYKFVPMLLMCYFLPSLLTLFHVVDESQSKLYFMASRYLLPASLVLLTLSVDLGEIIKLGPKALIMFLTGSIGVMLGGPLAILIVGVFAPDLVGGDDVWRGLTTVAGSWIGGGANQAAMLEVWKPSPEIYSVMVTIDVLVAEFWMMFLLLGIGQHKKIDAWLRADNSSVVALQEKMDAYSQKSARMASTTDLMLILAAAFGCTAVAHFAADIIAPWIGSQSKFFSQISLDSNFFWLVVLATILGVLLSFTKARELEHVGASKVGTVFIFILVATIGMKMHLSEIASNLGLFAVGLVWMMIHVGLLFLVAYIIRAPYFFLAVGSKANIGGAASAPVVAAAFHPSLAPVGVLLAVLGYVLGSAGAYLCGLMMRAVS